MQFTTGDAGPYGEDRREQYIERHVDPITELDASLRSWLRLAEAAKESGESLAELNRQLTNLQGDWQTLNKRLQSVFMLLALAKRAVKS